MDPLVILAILALLIFGPRRGGRPHNRIALAFAGVLLLVLAFMFGLGSLWNWLLEDFGRR
jgi:hypothetical protein